MENKYEVLLDCRGVGIGQVACDKAYLNEESYQQYLVAKTPTIEQQVMDAEFSHLLANTVNYGFLAVGVTLVFCTCFAIVLKFNEWLAR